MEKSKLMELVTLLFHSKGKQIPEAMLKSWIMLLKNYPDEQLINVIEKLIFTKDDFISIGQIYEMIYPPVNYDEKALEAWEIVRKFASEGKSATGNELIDDCMKSIHSIQQYGYLTDDFQKEQIRRDFVKIYKQKLKEKDNYEICRKKLSCLRKGKGKIGFEESSLIGNN